MLSIAGAVLINAACVLMASGRDTFDVYAMQRLLLAAGGGLVALDLTNRFREYFRKAKAQSAPVT